MMTIISIYLANFRWELKFYLFPLWGFCFHFVYVCDCLRCSPHEVCPMGCLDVILIKLLYMKILLWTDKLVGLKVYGLLLYVCFNLAQFGQYTSIRKFVFGLFGRYLLKENKSWLCNVCPIDVAFAVCWWCHYGQQVLLSRLADDVILACGCGNRGKKHAKPGLWTCPAWVSGWQDLAKPVIILGIIPRFEPEV